MDTKIFKKIDSAAISFAADVIKSSGLVAFPTETVYGLGANALDASASEKIYKAKGRPSDNPLIVHIANPEDAEKYCVTSPIYYKLAEKFMPGPLTVIMPKKDIVPFKTTGGLDSVAIRVPSHPIAHALIEAAGLPIAAPSANISGKPSPTTFAHIENDLVGRADVLLDGGDCIIGLESTIISLCSESEIKLLRPGAVTVEMLREICPYITIDPSITEKYDGVPLAPGMKYRHYAPEAPLKILDGSDEKVYDFIRCRKNCGILCFESDAELLAYPHSHAFGSKDSPETQAHELFACLRLFDNEDVSEIYARMPSTKGIGLAVFNRLIKAAGYEIIKL